MQINNNGSSQYISSIAQESDLLSGGIAEAATHYMVAYGATMTDKILYPEDTMVVYNGTVERITVSSGAYIEISRNGTAKELTVESGGGLVFSIGKNSYIQGTSGGSAFEIKNGCLSNYTITGNGGIFAYNFNALDNTTISSGGKMYVRNLTSAQSEAANTTVSSGGLLEIQTGKAKNTTLMQGGEMRISTDSTTFKQLNLRGTASGTIISGGVMHLSSHSLASDTQIASGGSMHIYRNGSAAGVTISSGGSMYVVGGGWADWVNVLSGGELTVRLASGTYLRGYCGNNEFEISNNKSDGFTLYSGISLLLTSNGITDNVVLDGGCMHVSGSGSATNTTLKAGAVMNVLSGGITKNNIVSSGELQVGGTADSNTVFKSGAMHIKSGGQAGSNIVSGGTLCISGAGKADSTTVFSGGKMHVSSGALAADTAISSGGKAYVYAGGSAAGITISSAGKAYVYAGGSAAGITISSGGSITVEGNISDLKVSAGGYIGGFAFMDEPFIEFKSIVDGVFQILDEDGIFIKGEDMYVTEGCAMYRTNQSYGTMHVTGAAATAGDTRMTGGVMAVGNRGSARNTRIGSSAELIVCNGGCALNTDVSGTLRLQGDLDCMTLESGIRNLSAKISSAVINSGGFLSAAYGSVIDTEIKKGGKAVIGEKTDAVNLNITGGSVHISSGAALTSTTVYSGFIYVSSGAALTSTIASGGSMFISSGSTLSSAMISGGRTQLTGGSASDLTAADGVIYVTASGTADAIRADNCLLYVDRGGLASASILSNCRVTFFSGGKMNVTFLNGGSMSLMGGLAENTVVTNSGEINISSGGAVVSTTISDGKMSIESGGSASHTLINIGYMYVYNGAAAENTTVSGVTENTPSLLVYNGGQVNHTKVNYGTLHIFSGGSALNTSVSSIGAVHISSGGCLGGTLQLASGAVCSAYSGAIINFDLTERETADGNLINDLSLISGVPSFTVTVSADQKYGRYKLAGGAKDCDISVTIGDGTLDFGTMHVNNYITYNDSKYSLIRVGSDISLIVSEVVEDEPDSSMTVKLSWEEMPGAKSYVVEISQNNFADSLTMTVSTNQIDAIALPTGQWQWRVRDAAADTWSSVNEVTVNEPFTTARKWQAEYDGNLDVFFVNSSESWGKFYAAVHQGVRNGWQGTGEEVMITGKNVIADVFKGSEDANVLVLTDTANGDALFVDDIYASLGKDAAMISQIDEIRAGFGDDVIDMTSQKFDYSGDGVKIYGGSGNDTIWANQGGNILFGDAGNDRIIGGEGDDTIIGGSGDDRMHGGGGEDLFCFGGNWGNDTIEQLENGSVTLWFDEGSAGNWDASAMTYTDGDNSVKVTGAVSVTVKFGDTDSAVAGAFLDAASEKIFDNKDDGMLA